MAAQTEEKLTDPRERTEEQVFDVALRPRTLEEFVGQDQIKENLQIFIDAAKRRGESLEHVLIYGNPGLGKTTLAHIIAREMGGQIRITSGPALERVGDLAAILTNLEEGDVLFIDEVHRMNRTIEEALYPAMEEYALDLVIGKGPSARTLRMQLKRFTLIGATTKMSLLSSPLRDRFGATYHLDFYTDHDIQKILERSATLLKISIDAPALELLSARSRRTPRVANRLLKRVRDFAEVKGDGVVTHALTEGALQMLDVDVAGLDRVDRLLLQAIIEKFGGGPVGLNTLAAATAEEMDTIESIYEPYLLQMGFLERTPRGRVATPRAYEHLGVPASMRQQQNLI